MASINGRLLPPIRVEWISRASPPSGCENMTASRKEIRPCAGSHCGTTQLGEGTASAAINFHATTVDTLVVSYQKFQTQ